jgi:hypothetical protein
VCSTAEGSGLPSIEELSLAYDCGGVKERLGDRQDGGHHAEENDDIPCDHSDQKLRKRFTAHSHASHVIEKQLAAFRQGSKEEHNTLGKCRVVVEVPPRPRRPTLCLQKEVAETMMALTRGMTLIYFGKRHNCS